MHCDPGTATRRHDDDTSAFAPCLLLALGFVLAGIAIRGAWSPALAWPWSLPPLPARCLAAFQAGAALACLLAVHERDGAAWRIPLAQMLGSSLCTLLLLAVRRPELPPGPVGWAWPALHAVAVAGPGWLLWRQRELQAPAERPDRALLACGATAAAVAALLALDPARAARLWPWPLGAEPSLQYAGTLAGWSVALVMLAHERRRGVRRHMLWALAATGALVVLASCLHLAVFQPRALGLPWAAAFAGISILALRRLAGPGRRGRASGVRPARPSDR